MKNLDKKIKDVSHTLNANGIMNIILAADQGTYHLTGGGQTSDPDFMLLLTLLRIYIRNSDDIEFYEELAFVINRYANDEERIQLQKAALSTVHEDLVQAVLGPKSKEEIN
jgi:hypothetical protein